MDAAESIIDQIIDGLIAELELERELGNRIVEIDRSLLIPEKLKTPPVVAAPVAVPPPTPKPSVPQATASQPTPPPLQPAPTKGCGGCKVVFLHHRPLSPQGVEMVAKITEKVLRLPEESAPVVVEPPIPSARIAIVLGGLALKKHFPEMNAAPGQWLRSRGGHDVLVTYSPEYILRFATATDSMNKLKKAMMQSLKVVMQRLESSLED